MELELECGVTIQLAALNQYLTYEGLLEGVPTRKMNTASIKAACRKSEQIWNAEPYLIEPEPTPIDLGREYPFGEPESIPEVTCLSRWRCPNQSRGDQFGWSQLTLIWYQADFGTPTEPLVLDQLKALDWHALSTFHEY